jgi:hypothetical protein
MSRKTLLAFIVCGLMILLSQPESVVAADPHVANTGTLAGSWELTFTPAPGTTTVPSIPGLATFTTDGSLVETDGTELAPGIASSTGNATYGSPGHGVWQTMPSLTSYYVFYTSVIVNADGTLNSKSITQATVTISTASSGTTFSGDYTTTTTGPSGVPPVTTSGKLSGQLIPHPALP